MFGVFGDMAGQLNRPRNIALDDDENIYLMSSYKRRIEKFNSEGEFIQSFGTGNEGSEPGDFGFDGFSDIVIDKSGNLYVLDVANYRVQVFNSQGSVIRILGATGDFGFSSELMAIGPKDRLYVYGGSGRNRTVKVFTLDGVFSK